jgi:multimeric flavodoxin WrbA
MLLMHCFDRYYSMYGHVEKLAEEIKKGATSVEGVEAKLWQASISVTQLPFPSAFRCVR